MTTLAPTPHQAQLLAVAAHANVLAAGGRGGGKSHGAILCILQHVVEFGPAARPLVVREQWGALIELQAKFNELCHIAFGRAVSSNKSEGTISLPTGGQIGFTNISDEEAVRRAQGRSYTGLLGDEIGTLPPQQIAHLNRLRSNLRVPVGKRPMLVYTANPFGKAHAYITKNHINKAPPWKAYKDPGGDLWINAPSTLTDNPHIDQEQYRRQLINATHGDPGLAQAWIEGIWAPMGGNLFHNFDPAVHVVEPPPRYLLDGARFVVGSDWGTASPATGILLAELARPFGPFLAGDVIALDETDTLISYDDLSTGDGRPPQAFAKNILALLNKWECPDADVVVDSARGLEGDTVLQHFIDAGLNANLPDKRSRVEKWDMTRARLARTLDRERRGLFISTNCPALLETLPEAPRSPLRPEEMDPKYNADHHIDGFVYGLAEIEGGPASTSGTTIGGW